MKRYKIVNAKRFATFVIATVLFVAFFIGILASKPKYEIVDYTTRYISSGDTLWAIAESINPGIDVRKVVWDIEQMNTWDGAKIIYPGDVISIPVYEQVN